MMSLAVRRFLPFFLILGLAACTRTQIAQGDSANACILTEPVWVKPPEDSAVLSPPAHSYYFINEDSSILASASWATEEQFGPVLSKEWIKVGWFRPAGAELKVTGQRLDGEAPPLEFEAPCCYPTRFQASGLYFPTEGCWRVTARADESELSFIIRVENE